MFGITTEPENYYEPPEDPEETDEWLYERCVHRDEICEDFYEMHGDESVPAWEWCGCASRCCFEAKAGA